MASSRSITPLVITLLATACTTQKPVTLGVVDGKLALCPSAPHCVSSQLDSGMHAGKPIPYDGSREEARTKLSSILRTMPGAVVLTESSDYVRAEFTSKTFKWVDDVEIYLDDRAKLAQIRSSSRTGFYDLGANRRRIEEIRKRFLSETTEPADRRAPQQAKKVD